MSTKPLWNKKRVYFVGKNAWLLMFCTCLCHPELSIFFILARERERKRGGRKEERDRGGEREKTYVLPLPYRE